MNSLAQLLAGITNPPSQSGGMASKGGVQRQPVQTRPGGIGSKGGARRQQLPTQTQFGNTPIVQHTGQLPSKGPNPSANPISKVPTQQAAKPSVYQAANQPATGEMFLPGVL